MPASVPKAPPYDPPGPETVQLIHADDTLIIADKPAGLLSVPGRGADKAASLLTYLEDAHGPLHAVHRLDMDTSGLIVMARTAGAHRTMSDHFATRRVTKAYHALVHGAPGETSGRVDLPIGRDWAQRPLRRIDPAGKPAVTNWSLEQVRGDTALINLRPVTGRTHQLRLHLSAIGFPILGDRLYGIADGSNRLCLHASALQFPHPETGAELTLKSPHPFGE